MRLDHNNRNALLALSPITLERYLSARDWLMTLRVHRRFSRWVFLEAPRQVMVDVPLKRSFADYAQRVADVITIISDSESAYAAKNGYKARDEAVVLKELQSIESTNAIMFQLYCQVATLPILCSEAVRPFTSSESLEETKATIALRLSEIDLTLDQLNQKKRLKASDILEAVLQTSDLAKGALFELRSHAPWSIYGMRWGKLYEHVQLVFAAMVEEGRVQLIDTSTVRDE